MQLFQDEAGQYFVKVPGGGMRAISEDEARVVGEGALESFGSGIRRGAEQLFLGAGQLMAPNPETEQALARSQAESGMAGAQNPLASFAGEMVPAAAAGGVGTMGARGALALIGRGAASEAAIGAAQTPQNPLAGAAIGGTLGAALPGGGSLTDRILTRARGLRARGSVGAAQVGEGAAMDIAQEAPTDQALEGLLTPGDLRALGIQVTPGDEAALLARRGTGELDWARNVRAQEELDRTVPVLGDRVNQIRGEQQDGLTRAVARELGLEGQEALTDSAVGRALNNLGQQFDRVADELGPAPIPDRAAFTESLEEIRDLAPADLEARANQWIETIQKSVDQSGGYLTPDTFQRMRTRLGKEIQAAGRAGDMGRVTTAGDMLDLLENTIQEGAPTALRQEIQELRRQYRIAKTLTKPGVIQRGDGRGVNAASFAQNWRRAGGDRFYRGAENDQIGRLAETVAFLTTKVTPSSGTGERVLNALKRRAVSAGTFGAL